VSDEAPAPRRRRPRYAGKYPRKFAEKYKELDPAKYPETVARVLASGKTPAGMHVPIMVREILEVLAPQPGERFIDCTLGYGGHAREILPRLQPGGRLIGLDVDPLEQPRTEERLRTLGFGPDVFTVRRANFAALPRVVAEEGRADGVLADLGVSSMQLDTPERGFSVKIPGPLDMRMNPAKGASAAEFLARISPADLATLLRENADEPRAEQLAAPLAGRHFSLTTDLTSAVRAALAKLPEAEQDKAVRRVFQAVRIAVNDEFAVLDTLLRHLPDCLAPGGRVAILTFHSGEDRRVKKAFEAALTDGRYAAISEEVIRASPDENRANPRATSAKLRWARKA
jgi:16S rRNA (cytosine1402-N4)-methyltransferase